MSLSKVSTEELYLQKACQVNLNYSSSVCTNLTQHEDIQVETQTFVSAVQAYNGILQSMPGILFTLFAGPLSDSHGRKPLMVIPLFGFLILNVVLLVNSIWMQELQVEFLLFECLQDLTGGAAIFSLAANSYIVDITREETRTARLCFVEAATSLGWMIGSFLGAKIKAKWGYTTLFSINLGLVCGTLLFSVFFLKDSIDHVSEERRREVLVERRKKRSQYDKGVFGNVFMIAVSSFKTGVRMRPHRRHLLVYLVIATILYFSSQQDQVLFMFYRKQYKMDAETFGLLESSWGFTAFPAQLFLVPFLSLKLGLRDTTIIILALITNSAGILLEALCDQIWVVFFSWSVLGVLLSNIFINMNSAISKLVETTEIGKILCLLNLSKSVMSVCGKPVFAFIYQASLSLLPALTLYITLLLFLMMIGLAVYNHIGMNQYQENTATTQCSGE